MKNTADDNRIKSAGAGLPKRAVLLAAACAAVVAAAGFAGHPSTIFARTGSEETSDKAPSAASGLTSTFLARTGSEEGASASFEAAAEDGAQAKAQTDAADGSGKKAGAENGAQAETDTDGGSGKKAGEEASSGDSVTVSAQGSALGTPDLADLRFGVRTQAETATAAQDENGKTVKSVLGALKKSGVGEDRIQTTWYDVSPQYDWDTGDGSKLTGYVVTTSLSVKDVKIDETGSLITACTRAGATEFNGMSFHCSDYDTLYNNALENAVASAKKRAGVLAKASGRSLGRVLTIREGWQDTTYASSSSKSFNVEEMSAADTGAADFMPGQAQITANLTVTYELR